MTVSRSFLSEREVPAEQLPTGIYRLADLWGIPRKVLEILKCVASNEIRFDGLRPATVESTHKKHHPIDMGAVTRAEGIVSTAVRDSAPINAYNPRPNRNGVFESLVEQVQLGAVTVTYGQSNSLLISPRRQPGTNYGGACAC